MQFSSSLLIAIVALMSSATASPIKARQAALEDWQVTTVGVNVPSGRPGNYPWATITAVITDPNQYNLGNSSYNGTPVIVPSGSQGFDCKAEWFIDSPVGRAWPCKSSSYATGYWYMHVLEGDDGQFSPSNFKLQFTHMLNLVVYGQQFRATIRGQTLFKVGVNMGGTCGGSGVCGWGLKAESKPQLITPTMV
ncbi:hypothetical protein P153DRAFT_287827 [Dothidotthia symphoricarpi CBS 119687]|uniref:Cell death in tomato 1 n=1 Tax=Dothidotthia symphoricarpi CBS 119687 TaxID=1392245 RepID=A0A6A6AGQ2_9PLEO|nr:uncharacterized protein P153DRAFT_287827 [Dothidotthia symphoricarpi CBS 119687]KAF2130980.1 hypothetical protein P153DRAFT_287827 [Dothidotthia symphoricarpi CBS 119687]